MRQSQVLIFVTLTTLTTLIFPSPSVTQNPPIVPCYGPNAGQVNVSYCTVKVIFFSGRNFNINEGILEHFVSTYRPDAHTEIGGPSLNSYPYFHDVPAVWIDVTKSVTAETCVVVSENPSHSARHYLNLPGSFLVLGPGMLDNNCASNINECPGKTFFGLKSWRLCRSPTGDKWPPTPGRR